MIFYALLGIGSGTLGTLIGAGGGFILVPVLLMMFPDTPAIHIAAISMLAVAANAISGSINFAANKRIHWKAALFFSVACLPGTALGLVLAKVVQRSHFEFIFGSLLLGVAMLLYWRSGKKKDGSIAQFELTPKRAALGCVISIAIGTLASFFGVGGGIFYVPIILIEILKFPVHLATGTSQFILGVTAVVTVMQQYRLGHYINLPSFVPYLVVGVVLGAQLGAYISKRVQSKTIIRVLCVALVLAGLRLMARTF